MRITSNFNKSLLIGCAATIVTSCTQVADNEVTPQGTIALEKITLGSPESTLKEAMITFVRDPSASANAGGKSQYLSRPKTTAGGQYMVQCKDGTVFQISQVFTDPTSKEAAVIELKKLLPPSAPEQSRVEEKATSDIYYYGTDYTGELNFKDDKKVQVINLTTTNVLTLEDAKKATATAKEETKRQLKKAPLSE